MEKPLEVRRLESGVLRERTRPEPVLCGPGAQGWTPAAWGGAGPVTGWGPPGEQALGKMLESGLVDWTQKRKPELKIT